MQRLKKLFFCFVCLAFISLACLSPKEPFATYPAGTPRAPQAGQAGQAPTVIKSTVAPVAAAPSPQPSPVGRGGGCAVISADEALHLRVGPDEHSRSLAFMTSGEVVKLISAANVDWWRIKIGDQIGYARSKYLKKSECEGRP